MILNLYLHLRWQHIYWKMKTVSPNYSKSAWLKNPAHFLENFNRLVYIINTNLQCEIFLHLRAVKNSTSLKSMHLLHKSYHKVINTTMMAAYVLTTLVITSKELSSKGSLGLTFKSWRTYSVKTYKSLINEDGYSHITIQL